MNAALVRRRQLFCICLCGEKIDSADFVSSGCDCRDVRVGNLDAEFDAKEKSVGRVGTRGANGCCIAEFDPRDIKIYWPRWYKRRKPMLHFNTAFVLLVQETPITTSG
jgi:hypothetical protein